MRLEYTREYFIDKSVDTGEVSDCLTDEAIREVLGYYNKTMLQSGDFPLGLVHQAYDAAELYDMTVTGGDKPDADTTRVYKI